MPPTTDREPLPRRPGPLEERLSARLFRALAPRLPARPLPDPPQEFGPWERLEIPRLRGLDPLSGVLFSAAPRESAPPPNSTAGPRGVVLLAPPWQARGQVYFYRHGRLEALRAAGYAALTFDLGGFRAQTAPPRGFADADVTAAFAVLSQRFPGVPLHFWGVSAGGYWGHVALTAAAAPAAPAPVEVGGAMFEDVSPHLLEWSKRMAPRGYPAYLFFQTVFRRSYRFLDINRHAPHLRARAVAYAGGGRDPGIRANEIRALAEHAEARCWIVDEANHLEAIQRDRDQVIRLALATFERGA